MTFFDLPLEDLRKFKPERDEPDDFDSFWKETLEEVNQNPVSAQFDRIDTGIKTLDCYDVTFVGFGGQPIKGWFLCPQEPQTQLPGIIEYIGYGGGRGFPSDWLFWPSMGFSTLVMDTRGQGSGWRQGDTPDNSTDSGDVHYPGFLTRGILDPRRYYYRRLISDAIRAVDAICEAPIVDSNKIAVTGSSQGGGVALAVAGLSSKIQAVMPDVPFLCHYRRATEITAAAPYSELSHFLQTHRLQVETVFRTLSYFDGVNFSARATARALFSVALMDEVSPPSTVFAAYNHYKGPKEINVWQYNHHEGGESYQKQVQLKFLNRLWQ